MSKEKIDVHIHSPELLIKQCTGVYKKARNNQCLPFPGLIVILLVAYHNTCKKIKLFFYVVWSASDITTTPRSENFIYDFVESHGGIEKATQELDRTKAARK